MNTYQLDLRRFENPWNAAAVLRYDYDPDSGYVEVELDDTSARHLFKTPAGHLFSWHGINPSLYYRPLPDFDEFLTKLSDGWVLVAFISPPDMHSEIDYESMEWNRFDSSIELGCALG